ncbi:peptidylprolyl isomerase [uncultured Ferrovibrio sp.]|jgi:peptidyl-prolyl cis-trans isomerase D|uniref:peptidylprolyl isomerase n=1 Tax=uncultured Ferrovibrio sp. TaxID=1576913 RepID=UPI002611CB93|nr:peptidylprolyl isomerase [uncultured Ferrovibrio sp.]
MLQQMRKGAASWVAKGLMVLLVLSFGAWGIGDYITNFGTNAPVAKVGDAEIGQPEYADAWRRELTGLQRRFGGNFTAEQARQLGLDENVLNRLIEDRLYQQAAKDLGLTITEVDVRHAIMNAPAFKGPTGQFDRFAFENYLRQEGYSEAMLVSVLTQELARTRLLGSLFGSMATAPTQMADTILGYRLERRLAEFVVVDAAKLPAPPAPTDEKIEEYYKANPAAFTAPERRSVAWFQITPADRAAKIEVAEDELRDEYEANKQAYVTQEKRDVEQVVFPTEAEAKAAYEAVQKGEDFLAMAARTQKLKPEDVKLGSVTKDALPAAIANAVFGLDVNKVGEPVTSPFGWHVVRVTAVQPGSTKSFEEAKAELRQQIALTKANDEMGKLRAQIDDQIAGGATIEEIVKAQGAELRTAADIDAQGRDKQGKPVEGLPAQPDFLAQAFDLDTESEPHIVDQPDGGLIVLKVTGVTPAALRPLDDVKSDVVARLQQRDRADAAAEQARQIAERVRNGGDLAKEAAAIGAAVQLSAPLTRSGQPAERALSPVVVSALFNAKQPGEVVTGPAASAPGITPNSAVVARLSRIEPADPAAIASQRDQTVQQLASSMAQDLVQQYRQALQQEIGVKVDPAARARAAGF